MMTKKQEPPSPEENLAQTPLLVDVPLTQEIFPSIEAVIEVFRQPSFLALNRRKRFRQVNETLHHLIADSPTPAFLLSAVLDFFTRVNQEKILPDSFNMASFEFWLNQFSGLTDQENEGIRAKIVGKLLPRQAYQCFFPIGMDKMYSGTHFVTAHLSPDTDTTIASFWGWVDAFAARVGSGLHLWSLPGGPPDSPFTLVFQEIFGPYVFSHLPRTGQTLTLTAMDLVTQKQFSKELGSTLVGSIDHASYEKAVILINEQGHYLGDWRSSDVEPVRQIIILFKSCLRWFENNLHTHLISLFAKANLSTQDFPSFNHAVFDVKIRDCEPALEFNEKQKGDLHDFFQKILGVKEGLSGTFRALNQALAALSLADMLRFQEKVEALPLSNLFDERGNLKEDRPRIFTLLQEIIQTLDEAILNVRNYVERLDIVVGIKHDVLKIPPLYLTLQSDVDEIKRKMQDEDFLTVVIQEHDNTLFPVGIVREKDLRKSSLGTVSFRDFCNFEEVKMASYLEVISVIDHHKTSLKTSSVPFVMIGDAQSCNVLIAELAWALNDKYGLGGMTKEEIDTQLRELSALPPA